MCVILPKRSHVQLIAYDGPAVILYSMSITISHVMFLAKRDFCTGANHTESINRLEVNYLFNDERQ